MHPQFGRNKSDFFISAHNRYTRNLAVISTSVPYLHGPFPLTEARKKEREKDHGSTASALRARRMRKKDSCLGITLSSVPAWLWPLARPRAVCMEHAIASSSSAHSVSCPKNHRIYCVCYLICKLESFSAFWCEVSPLLPLYGLSRGQRIFVPVDFMVANLSIVSRALLLGQFLECNLFDGQSSCCRIQTSCDSMLNRSLDRPNHSWCFSVAVAAGQS